MMDLQNPLPRRSIIRSSSLEIKIWMRKFMTSS
jgi:hypothetical protein